MENRAPDTKLLKFHANRDSRAYLKKCDFQQTLFNNSETTIGFMTSKQV